MKGSIQLPSWRITTFVILVPILFRISLIIADEIERFRNRPMARSEGTQTRNDLEREEPELEEQAAEIGEENPIVDFEFGEVVDFHQEDLEEQAAEIGEENPIVDFEFGEVIDFHQEDLEEQAAEIDEENHIFENKVSKVMDLHQEDLLFDEVIDVGNVEDEELKFFEQNHQEPNVTEEEGEQHLVQEMEVFEIFPENPEPDEIYGYIRDDTNRLVKIVVEP